MATGTGTGSTYTQTAVQICSRAARLVSAIKGGETLGNQELTDFLVAANGMVKHWEAMDIHVWAVEEAVLFPAINQIRYAMGSGATDHVCDATLYVPTTLTAAAGAGTTSIPVAAISSSGNTITSGDNIGIVQTDGSLFWTTVNGAPTGLSVPLTAGLSVGAAVGAAVYDYTSNIVRPLRVPDARRFNIASGLDTPLRMIARSDYQALPNKSQVGQINQAFYDAQLATGYMNIWQPLSGITDLFHFTWHRPLHNFDLASNTPDLPDEWGQTLAYNLAVVMAPEYDCPMERFNMIAAQARQYLDEVGGFDREYESVMFGVDMNP